MNVNGAPEAWSGKRNLPPAATNLSEVAHGEVTFVLETLVEYIYEYLSRQNVNRGRGFSRSYIRYHFTAVELKSASESSDAESLDWWKEKP